MEDVKIWASLIGNFGLPIVFVLWYFIVDRPAQRKREETLETNWKQWAMDMLKDQRTENEQNRVTDKAHALELAKLSGEIHKTATQELATAIGRNSDVIGKNTEEVERLGQNLNRTLEEFRTNRGRRT